MAEYISPGEADALLSHLCVAYGFCLSPLWRARLTQNPPKSAVRFTDTMFRAEGLQPETVSKRLYQAMHDEVKRAFERSQS